MRVNAPEFGWHSASSGLTYLNDETMLITYRLLQLLLLRLNILQQGSHKRGVEATRYAIVACSDMSVPSSLLHCVLIAQHVSLSATHVS